MNKKNIAKKAAGKKDKRNFKSFISGLPLLYSFLCFF